VQRGGFASWLRTYLVLGALWCFLTNVHSAVTGAPSVRETRQLAIEGIVQRARAAGADAQGITWVGAAGESIVDVAEAESADLIVVGTHERGAVGRLFLGSVSDHVVRHASCPVMVVRPTRVAAVAGSS